MDQNVAIPLTDDEYTILMIAAQGESLMPIGRWERPVEQLVDRGLLHRHDKFNNTITEAGRKAIVVHEESLDVVLRHASTVVATTQSTARKHAEQAAQELAAAAKASVAATGDKADTAVLNWNGEVLRRALELVRE